MSGMVCYRKIKADELDVSLFQFFIRRQIVNRCRRKINGEWKIVEAPSIDDWSEDDYTVLVKCLLNTLSADGFVYGAFINDELKGFVSVEGTPIGSRGQYMDLTSIHVSQDVRSRGIGRELFSAAKNFAKENGAEKLYISAHPSVESQAFYQAMGCKEAEEYCEEHTEQEPYDCQLECNL